jgi:hypothetical protein
MSGMESSTFGFDVSTKSFSMRRKCVIKSISLETLQSYAENFIQVISILKFWSDLLHYLQRKYVCVLRVGWSKIKVEIQWGCFIPRPKLIT